MKNYKNISLFSIAAMVISTLMVLLYQKPSYAYFEACNKTNRKIYVAYAYDEENFSYIKSIDKVGRGPFVVQGWINLSPGECETRLGSLKALRNIYTYAHSTSRKYLWEGNYSLCASDYKFRLGLNLDKGSRCEDNFNYNLIKRKSYYNLGFRRHKLNGGDNYTLNFL